MVQQTIGPHLFPTDLALPDVGPGLRAMAEVVGTMQGFLAEQDRHVPGVGAGEDRDRPEIPLRMYRARITGAGGIEGRYQAVEIIFDANTDQYVDKLDGWRWNDGATPRDLPEILELNRFIGVPTDTNVFVHEWIDAQGRMQWDFHYLTEGSQGSDSDSIPSSASSSGGVAYIVRPCTPADSGSGDESGGSGDGSGDQNPPGNSGGPGDATAFRVRTCASDDGSNSGATPAPNACDACSDTWELTNAGVTGTLTRSTGSYCYFTGYVGTEDDPTNYWQLIWHGSFGRYLLRQGADYFRHEDQPTGTPGQPVGCPLDGTYVWLEGDVARDSVTLAAV